MCNKDRTSSIIAFTIFRIEATTSAVGQLNISMVMAYFASRFAEAVIRKKQKYSNVAIIAILRVEVTDDGICQKHADCLLLRQTLSSTFHRNIPK